MDDVGKGGGGGGGGGDVTLIAVLFLAALSLRCPGARVRTKFTILYGLLFPRPPHETYSILCKDLRKALCNMFNPLEL